MRVQSTLGLTDEDVAALAALDGVETAEGGWSETAYTTVGSASEKVDVKALSSSGLNEPLVLEGRLPEAAGEAWLPFPRNRSSQDLCVKISPPGA